MTEEIWKPAYEWENAYAVSNLGRVKSLSRIVNNTRGQRLVQERIRKLQRHCFGYPMVMLSFKNKQRRVHVHRLMYESFHGPLLDGLQVRHINNDPTDCRLVNLVAGTSADNHADMVAAGRSTAGQRHHNSKISEADVLVIRSSDDSSVVLAMRYGIGQSAINRIRQGVRWSHVA